MYELTPKWQCKIPKNQRRKELFALKTLSVIEIFIQPENYVIYKCPFFFLYRCRSLQLFFDLQESVSGM